ncbi:single-stranded DNA-binding protein [Cutibacterium sp. WCA-380-WT-3A]|uniref:Single-stranded DNA-binding protein n=1 Tax=Cutibacterium porci TaxID=2605781 RepID=A0A7K0J9F7_9ACTN|nr:single-stranded DNA-binding protein [Cutibacterium porci]MSS46599.1 single-stranded DNA-binding protein [Cutibacterium porci]
MDANVSFTGNLGTDVEMKTAEGWRGARFRVAHTPRVMRQGEWVDGTTTWMSVHVYGRLADNCHVSLRKGDPVMVTGRLRTRSWIDDEGSHEQLIVVAHNVGPDLSRLPAVCRRPEKRADAPLGDDRMMPRHDSPGEVDEDVEVVDDDVELVGS